MTFKRLQAAVAKRAIKSPLNPFLMATHNLTITHRNKDQKSLLIIANIKILTSQSLRRNLIAVVAT
jgi:hypothetical protein